MKGQWIRILTILILSVAPVFAQSKPTSRPSSRPYRPRLKRYRSKTVATWREDLKSKERKTRRQAIVALGDYREEGWKAVADLLPFLDGDDSVLQEETISSLRRIGAPAVKAVGEVLFDKKESKRFAAAMTLFTMGAIAKDAVPSLCKALEKDSSSAIRSMAASALGKIPVHTHLSVPVLVKALRDKDGGVKRNAGAALAELGPLAMRAVPDLCALLKDKDVALRKTAATALGRMGTTAREAVPALAECLAVDSDWLVRLNAAEALGFIGDKAAIPGLTKALSDKNSAVQSVAKNALKQLNSLAKKKR
jgi:HEAT repeat protein